jgi:ABC-type multidrug transport system fused ATPase/permease subunit
MAKRRAARRARGGRVEYRNVSFAYRPDVPALHDINLVAKPGQCVALVGPTGAGKSTLVSLLSRFYEATGGEILLDGRNVAEIPLRELREQIGVVSQETFLFNGTILDNLRFGRPDATRGKSRRWPARPACTISSPCCRKATTRMSASGA